MNQKMPFRHDIVGSFLRPTQLKKARKQWYAGEISKEELTRVEDEEILKLINKQKEVGLKAVTDGEFRRRWWHLDFIQGLKGITVVELGDVLTFNNTKMEKAQAYYVSGSVAFNPEHPFLAHFKFVQKHADGVTAKQTIPGPNMIYLSGVISSPKYKANPAYSQESQLLQDIAKTYQDAIQAFYDAGCRYLQIDDTAWGALANPASIKALEVAGYTVDEVMETFTNLTKAALEKKPADMTITFHMCRGNFKSSWLYEGTYDTISNRLFSIEQIDGFFLEYDDQRSGSFKPLKDLRKQRIVLGLITSKTPELENKEQIIARIQEATIFVPLEQICLSPQCGFASTEEGNSLTEEEQWAKVKLVKEIADEVWKE